MKLSTLVSVVALLCNAAVHADTGTRSPSSKTVILIACPKERFEIDRLRDAIDAHMSDLGAQVLVKAVLDMPSDLETQLDVARALLRETAGTSAVWIEYGSDTLMLLVKDQNSEQILGHPIDERLKNSDQIYDAAASMVRAALTPWFSADEKEPSVEKKTSRQDQTEPTKPVPPPRAEIQKERRVRFQARAAYVLVANLEGPLSNGGAIGAGIVLIEKLLFGVDLRMLQSADMDVTDTDVRLLRLPLTLKTGLSFKTGPLTLGIEAGLTFDIAHVVGIDEADAPEPIQRMRLGFSPGGFLRYFPVSWMSIDLHAGVDIYQEPYHYRWNGAVVFTNGKIQPNGALGLSFYLPRAQRELKR